MSNTQTAARLAELSPAQPRLHSAWAAGDAPLSDDTLIAMHHDALPDDGDPRRARVPLQALSAQAPAEVWRGRTLRDAGWLHDCGYAHDGALLFAHTRIEAGADPQSATEEAYRRLHAVLQQHGYPHWLRTWNYLDRINEGDGDDERYKRFCVGRARALANRPDYERFLPAATAIGSAEPGGLVCALAGRVPGVAIENPRQVSAYRYPRQYGPKSPSFARAMLVRGEDTARLLVSGTASVVGHATRHADDLRAQLAETAANIDALLQHAAVSEFPDTGEPLWRAETHKLFVRDAADYPLLAEAHPRSFPGSAPLLALRGDICRRDLLLEVEGVYVWQGPRG